MACPYSLFQSLNELKRQLAKLVQDLFAAINDSLEHIIYTYSWQSKTPKEDHLSITTKRLFPNGVRFMEIPLYSISIACMHKTIMTALIHACRDQSPIEQLGYTHSYVNYMISTALYNYTDIQMNS